MSPISTRRHFLKTAGIAAASHLVLEQMPGRISCVHAAENNTISIGLVGCGGSGMGAVCQALAADPDTKLVAVGDAFPERAKNAANALKNNPSVGKQIKVGDNTFGGLDNYKKVIDVLKPGDAVILATPPAFRPLHFVYAVEKGLHIFAEKPLAVDTPGCKKILEANETAVKKNLKVAVGLMMRHHNRTEEVIRQIQDGVIGDIVSAFVYRMHSDFFPPNNPKLPPLQHQLLAFQGFPWGNGGFTVDWMIHSVDVACWAKKEDLPVNVQGQGGRATRTVNDQLYDHAAYEYQFSDGVKMMVQLRHIAKTFYYGGDWIFGTKGAARIGEGVLTPKIYKGYREVPENLIFKSQAGNNNHYQDEHNRFFSAIRENKNWNEIKRSIDATFTCIMARMAIDSGVQIQRDAAWTSTYEMAPGLENWTLESTAPVLPDLQTGRYSLAKPGTTKEF